MPFRWTGCECTRGSASDGAPTSASSGTVLVVGGRAAGLSGALALGRARRSVLVVDGREPRNASAAAVHNYLGRDGTPPGDLLAAARAEIAGYGGELIAGEVVFARPDPAGFVVGLADGRAVRARRLLVTTGLVDELSALPGVRELWGHDVLHCPCCHGWEVRDRPIGALSTGPFAVHQALMWWQWSARRELVPAHRTGTHAAGAGAAGRRAGAHRRPAARGAPDHRGGHHPGPPGGLASIHGPVPRPQFAGAAAR